MAVLPPYLTLHGVESMIGKRDACRVNDTQAEIKMKTSVSASKVKRTPPEIDLRPYAGRWVALVSGRVAGVGLTAEEARIAAKLSRPKEEPEVRFVPEEQLNSIQKELS